MTTTRGTARPAPTDADLTILLAKQRVYQIAIGLAAVATVVPLVFIVAQGNDYVWAHVATNVPALVVCLAGWVASRRLSLIRRLERVLLGAIVTYIIAWDIINLVLARMPDKGAVVSDAPVFLMACILLCLVVPQERLRHWLFGLFAGHTVLNWLNLARFDWGPTQSTQLTTDIITLVSVTCLSLVGLYQRMVVTAHADLAAMRDLAHTDTLTQLPNRRAMYAALDHDGPLAVALIDLDDFKVINDTRGHMHGDDVLIRVAALLRISALEVGTVGRWGGEEFLVVLPGMNLDQASRWGELARRTVERTSGETTTTLSMGVTTRHDGESVPAMLRRADELMYLAKRRGKNQVSSG